MWLKGNSRAWPQLLHPNPSFPCLAWIFPNCLALHFSLLHQPPMQCVEDIPTGFYLSMKHLHFKETQKTPRVLIHLICHFSSTAKIFHQICLQNKCTICPLRNTISPGKSTIFGSNLKLLDTTEFFLHKHCWHDGEKYNTRLSTLSQFYHGACCDLRHSLSLGFGLTAAGGCGSWQTGNIRGSDDIGLFFISLVIVSSFANNIVCMSFCTYSYG